jgi:hypothetical protein
MLALLSFDCGQRTIQGYEAMNMIRKGQVRWFAKGNITEQVRFINVTFGLAPDATVKTPPMGPSWPCYCNGSCNATCHVELRSQSNRHKACDLFEPTIAPKVFICYSHDSPEHRDRALVNRLRQDGIDAMADQYAPAPQQGMAAQLLQAVVQRST